MFDLLKGLVNIVTTLSSLVLNIITSLYNFITKIPLYSEFIISSVNLLPTIIIPFAIFGISIYIILFIIGR